MNRMSTFQEILEGKMQEADVRETPPPRETGAAEPAHLAFLLGQTPVFRFQKPAPARTFRPTVSASARPSPLRPRRTQGAPHVLSERQKTAVEWFARFDEVLPPDFSPSELKAAFRRLARRLHPDHSGAGPAAFLELKGHHEALSALGADKAA